MIDPVAVGLVVALLVYDALVRASMNDRITDLENRIKNNAP